jgi:hypothetical protein
MESQSTPETPEGPGVENQDPANEVDPAARDEAGDQEAQDATPLSQDVPADQVEQTPLQGGQAGDPANQVHQTAPAPPEWQSGDPEVKEGAPSDRGPTQTAGGSTDGLSPNTTSDVGDGDEGDGGDDD